MERLERKRRDDTLVRGSSYLDVTESHPEWPGEPFIQEAEYLRDTNELAWRWEYLGEITGTGDAVFDNVHEAPLSDSRIRGFERVRNGVDWGWFPDPWRFVRCAWEPSERRLLIFEEHSANKTMPIDAEKIVVIARLPTTLPRGACPCRRRPAGPSGTALRAAFSLPPRRTC